MRAYIHGFQGKAYNTECQLAQDGFEELGIKTVLFTTNEEFDTRNPEDVVVGTTVIIWHALEQRGIPVEYMDYPEELKDFVGRKIWKTKLKDIKQEEPPFFMKPVEEKAAPGIVVNTWEDLDPYIYVDPETELYCSEAVHFVSEWRCFLLYGKIIGVHFYYGDREAEYDPTVIDAAVKVYPDMPAGFAMDFGVTDDGRTLLIEVNDGYSLGTYGLEATLYARLLSARWAEMNGTEDELKI